MLAQFAAAAPGLRPAAVAFPPCRAVGLRGAVAEPRCEVKDPATAARGARPSGSGSVAGSVSGSGSYSRTCVKYVATAASRARVGSATAATEEEAKGVTETGQFTLSETSLLQERGLELLRTAQSLDLDTLNALFVKVGFPRRQKEKLARALEHTLALVWLRDASSGRLVAFARATGDAVFNAIIWDVVVDPAYQGCGLGKVVLERLMADLIRQGISNIALYAEPNVVGFYKPLGFIADPDGIRAMAFSRRRR